MMAVKRQNHRDGDNEDGHRPCEQQSTTMMGKMRMFCWILRILLLLTVTRLTASHTNGDGCKEVEDEMVRLVSAGKLSEARWTAVQRLADSPDCKQAMTKTYVETFDQLFIASKEEEDEEGAYWKRISYSLQDPSTMKRPVAKRDREGCIFAVNGEDPNKEWDDCCSILPRTKKQTSSLDSEVAGDSSFSFYQEEQQGCGINNACCDYWSGSPSHLRLPVLHEPALRVIISLGKDDNQETTSLELEQDGYLRLFDVAAILWPSGYLLTLCVANPMGCQIPEIYQAVDYHLLLGASRKLHGTPIAMELGTGVGAPCIALALQLRDYLRGQGDSSPPLVVATDVAPQSLALTKANAWFNNANITTLQLNHTNITSVSEAKKRFFFFNKSQTRGFAMVLGSSLMGLFHGTQDPKSMLWTILDMLLDQNNPHALAILVHVRSDPLLPPTDGSFQLVRRISGDTFGMKTRAGESSDFEISVFQRSPSSSFKSEEEL
jgi:hypothetical protein